MPSVFRRPSAAALYGLGLSIEKVPPFMSAKRPPSAELVALSMAAEIIMVVENEDTRGFAPRAVKMRSR